MGALLLGPWTEETDDLVGANRAMLGRLAMLDHVVVGVVLEAGDEEDAGRRPVGEQPVVVVAPVHGDDGAGIEVEQACPHAVMPPRFSEQHVGGHVVVVVEQDVHLNAALGATEAGPGEERQAQGDGRRVQAQQLVLETELRLALAQAIALAQALGQVPEQGLEESCWPVGVGVGQGGALGGASNAHVHQLADATGQAVTDLA